MLLQNNHLEKKDISYMLAMYNPILLSALNEITGCVFLNVYVVLTVFETVTSVTHMCCAF